MKMQEYKYDFLNYQANNSVKSDCGDITFFNNGLNQVTINGALKLGFGSITLPCNAGEIDRTIYSFIFDEVVAGGNSIVVIRKIYV